MALEIYLDGTMNTEALAEAEAAATTDGDQPSDGDLMLAVFGGEDDSFVFVATGENESGAGFAEVSGLGAEVTPAEYREGSEYNPAWTDLNTADPGDSAVSSDPEWRYVPVRRTQAEDDDADPVFWDDGLF